MSPIFLTPMVRDRPPYNPDSTPSQVGLMRHFENRLRGVIVWLLDDGTYVVDTACNYEAAQTQPAAFISNDPVGPDMTADFPALSNTNAPYPWNPFPGSTNSEVPGAYTYITNWDSTTQTFVLEPHVAVEPPNFSWWQPGAENVVTQAEAVILAQAGFGDCVD